MKALASVLLFLLVACTISRVQAQITPAAGIHEDWRDAKRQRTVPVRMVLPTSGTGPFPVVIFSHGLGGSREGASYLGEHWSEHGYFVIYVQHPGSDSGVWQPVRTQGREAVLQNMKAAANGENLVLRAQDIHFVIDVLTNKNANDPTLKGKLDLSKIAMTGHSFGAGTALAVAGQMYPGITLKDERIKCAIYFSPPVNPLAKSYPQVFSNITVPGMVMTGTEDTSIIGTTQVEDRRVPFDAIPGKDQYLVNFIGGDHMIFSGHIGNRLTKDTFYQPKILELSTAFLDAYLKSDKQKLTWLKADAGKWLDSSAKYETK